MCLKMGTLYDSPEKKQRCYKLCWKTPWEQSIFLIFYINIVSNDVSKCTKFLWSNWFQFGDIKTIRDSFQEVWKCLFDFNTLYERPQINWTLHTIECHKLVKIRQL